MEIFERIRFLRKNKLNLSQEQFGERLGVSRSVIANIETNVLARPEQKEPLYKLICKEFNVRYEWLTAGQGDPFVQNEQTELLYLARSYDLDALDCKIIESFMRLSKFQRQAIKRFIMDVAEQEEVPTTYKIASREGKNEIELTREQREEMAKSVERSKGDDLHDLV